MVSPLANIKPFLQNWVPQTLTSKTEAKTIFYPSVISNCDNDLTSLM